MKHKDNFLILYSWFDYIYMKRNIPLINETKLTISINSFFCLNYLLLLLNIFTGLIIIRESLKTAISCYAKENDCDTALPR